MKKQFLTFLLVLAPLFCTLAQLRLPQASPLATINQTIGLTEIKITYHSPGVKGREIWGKLVPYGQLWRCGANEATLITFSDPVKINSFALPAGTYSFFILPEAENKWQAVFNKDISLWGTEGYKDSLDVLRVPIQAQAVPFHETLQYSFTNLKPSSGQLNLTWEKLNLFFTIEVETFAKALSNIKADLSQAKPEDWSIFAQAAQYLVSNNAQHELALDWINKSLKIKENFYNNWVKAKLLAQKNEFQEAINLAKKAMKLGQNDTKNYSPIAQEMERSLEEWKVKMHTRN
jgi:tetratricopeptide (TPR) repeat protein